MALLAPLAPWVKRGGGPLQQGDTSTVNQEEFQFEPPNRADKIEVAFRKFHAAHREVYVLFQKYARELTAAGRTRFSADAILHRIRFYHAVNPDKEFEGFKINDNFSSRYARLLAEDFPEEFGDFFEFRKLACERRPKI